MRYIVNPGDFRDVIVTEDKEEFTRLCEEHKEQGVFYRVSGKRLEKLYKDLGGGWYPVERYQVQIKVLEAAFP